MAIEYSYKGFVIRSKAVTLEDTAYLSDGNIIDGNGVTIPFSEENIQKKIFQIENRAEEYFIHQAIKLIDTVIQ